SCDDDCLPLTQEDLTSWQPIDSNNSALNSNTSTKKSLSPQKDKTISTQSSDQNDDEFYTNNKEFDETHRQEMQRRQELKLAAQKVTDGLKKKKKKDNGRAYGRAFGKGSYFGGRAVTSVNGKAFCIALALENLRIGRAGPKEI
ncbi:5268_t:CDS:2, partial [Entrophospora sp. SA101]